MACIDYNTWMAANTACQNATQSVRGLGQNYVPTGLRALRGLGASISATITPQSFFSSMTSGSIQTAVPLAPAPPTGYNASTLNVAPAVGTDPCAIASQVPCSYQGTCPQGYDETSPGPGVTNCVKHVPALTSAPPPIVCGAGFAKTCNPQPCHCAPVPQDTATMTTPSTSTAGFSQWGLLAVLAVGGFVVYKVATHKKASS